MMRFVFAVAASLVASAASAHVVLDKRDAAVGSYYKAVFKVGHGCDGSPTTAITVQIPDGVIAAKPMPKPGWTLALTKGAYAQEHAHHSHAVSEGVRSITWSGKLPDDYYDEFVVNMSLTDVLKPGETLYFPVTQTCETGVSKWIEIPEAGKPVPKMPAPGLKIVAEDVRGCHARPRAHRRRLRCSGTLDVPGIHVLLPRLSKKTWMAGTDEPKQALAGP